nr:hypothetical protein [uncultured Cohaesibacter sp.]
MSAESKKRKRLLVCVSCPRALEPALADYVGGEVTRLFGGVTFLTGLGFWSSDGAEFKNRYESDIQKENTMVMLLSVMPDREEEALRLIEKTFTAAKTKFALSYQSIHVESQDVTANHFQIACDN